MNTNLGNVDKKRICMYSNLDARFFYIFVYIGAFIELCRPSMITVVEFHNKAGMGNSVKYYVQMNLQKEIFDIL